MKRKLLFILPALMLLSSCAGAAPKAEQNLFIEDTLLHEEVFGGVDASFINNRKELPPDPVFPSSPMVGIQSVTKGTGDAARTSIRFIGAAYIEDKDLASATAVWTRQMFNGSGSQIKAATPFPCKKVYTSLYDGVSEDPYTISDFNTARGTSYNCFVVYTMLDIPTVSCAGYFLNAYLTVTNGEAQTSKVVSTTVDGTKRVSFATTDTGYFLRGNIDGNPDAKVSADNPNKGDGQASFTTTLRADDTFVVVRNDTSINYFMVFNSSSLAGDESSYFMTNDSGKIKAKYKANYILYLGNDGNVYTTATEVVRPLYISTSAFSWWGADGRWTAVYAYNEDVNPKRETWFYTESSGGYLVTTEAVDGSLYNKLIVVEMKAGEVTPSFDGKNNQTSGKSITNNRQDCAYVKDGGYGTFYYDWGTRS